MTGINGSTKIFIPHNTLQKKGGKPFNTASPFSIVSTFYSQLSSFLFSFCPNNPTIRDMMQCAVRPTISSANLDTLPWAICFLQHTALLHPLPRAMHAMHLHLFLHIHELASMHLFLFHMQHVLPQVF